MILGYDGHTTDCILRGDREAVGLSRTLSGQFEVIRYHSEIEKQP